MKPENCLSNSYDEKTGLCEATCDYCSKYNCPYDQYISDEEIERNIQKGH